MADQNAEPVTLVHPHPDDPTKPAITTTVSPVKAKSLRRQGWADADTDETVDDVKARVGSDPDAARTALAAEQARPKPRKGLVDHLKTLIPTET